MPVATARRVGRRLLPHDDVQVVRFGRLGQERAVQRDRRVALLREQQREGEGERGPVRTPSG